MAQLMIAGLDQVAAELTRISSGADEAVIEMLEAGGEVFVTTWQEAIDAADLVDTGSMHDNVKAGQLKKDASGGSIVIYPRGKDGRGTSNAKKAFIHHYGTSKNPATGFVDIAEQKGEAQAAPIVNAIWERHIKGG